MPRYEQVPMRGEAYQRIAGYTSKMEQATEQEVSRQLAAWWAARQLVTTRVLASIMYVMNTLGPDNTVDAVRYDTDARIDQDEARLVERARSDVLDFFCASFEGVELTLQDVPKTYNLVAIDERIGVLLSSAPEEGIPNPSVTHIRFAGAGMNPYQAVVTEIDAASLQEVSAIGLTDVVGGRAAEDFAGMVADQLDGAWAESFTDPPA